MGTRLLQTRALLGRRSIGIGLLALGLLAGLGAYVSRSAREAARWRELAQRALERQDLAAAGDHLRSYLAAVPASAEGHFLLAQTLRRDGKYDEAERALAAALRLGWDPPAVRRESFLARLQRHGVRDQSGDQ